MHGDEPEKSTNQLAVWRELLDALDKLDVAWENAQPPEPDTPAASQLPGNIAVALATAVEDGAKAISGMTDILVAQHDSGEAFQQVALALRHAVDQWPTGR